MLGTILLAGDLLLLAFSSICNEYGQLMFFHNHYWTCMECGSFSGITGIMSAAVGTFLLAASHRYLSYCSRRVQALA